MLAYRIALAKTFASRGYDLILAARNEEALAALAQELEAAHSVRAKMMPADLSVPGAAEAMVEALERAGVTVEILVNNAGVMFEGDFVGVAHESHLRLRQINVVALTSLTHLFLPAMIRRGGGRILNVASMAAIMPIPRLAAYAAAKAYVLSLTESLSEELQGTGVTATALCPLWVDLTCSRRRGTMGWTAPRTASIVPSWSLSETHLKGSRPWASLSGISPLSRGGRRRSCGKAASR